MYACYVVALEKLKWLPNDVIAWLKKESSNLSMMLKLPNHRHNGCIGSWGACLWGSYTSPNLTFLLKSYIFLILKLGTSSYAKLHRCVMVQLLPRLDFEAIQLSSPGCMLFNFVMRLETNIHRPTGSHLTCIRWSEYQVMVDTFFI